MSLVDNLRGKAAAPKFPGAPQAPEIFKQLEDARATLADLEARRDAASLDALADAGAKDTLAKLNADAKAGRAQLELLEAAHRGAVARDKAELLRTRKDWIETAQKSVISNLGLRDKAADLYAAAVADAAKHYKAMQRHTEQAYRAWTAVGMSWPQGALNELDIKRMASDEMWRHASGAIGGDPMAMPGATFSKLEYEHNPSAIARIDEPVRDDSAWLKEQIAKQVPK